MTLVEGSRLPDATKRKARFAMQLLNDALAPSNVPWMNPAVIKEAMNTGGASLMRGMQNFMEDASENHGMPRQVDSSQHKLGVNLAATPGRVVFRNELIELIAYEPQTPKVHAIPLLCSPPWINKYYIMDLAPRPIVRRMGRAPRASDVHDQLSQPRCLDARFFDGRLPETWTDRCFGRGRAHHRYAQDEHCRAVLGRYADLDLPCVLGGARPGRPREQRRR